MAYVPGFRHDVFVSYAMVDDVPPPDVDHGWVSTLIRNLQNQLAQRLGRADSYSLWMDRANLSAKDEIAPAIIENIRGSATLLLILSRGYLASEWCRREGNAFLDALKSRPHGEGSVFVVTTHKLDRDLWPNEFRDLIGYNFWSEDVITRRVSTLGYPIPNPRLDRPYYEKIHDLASDIVDTLQRLSLSTHPTPVPTEANRLPEPQPSVLPNALSDVLRAKLEKGEYDVFLCHNSEDKPEVKGIAKMLMARGILPWLDDWDLQPGLPWQIALEQQITNIRAAAVFVGESGFGPWQNMELSAFLRQFVHRNYPVIPVLLESCKQTPQLPAFLSGLHCVDFRRRESEPLDRFIWGITGKRLNIESRI